MRNGFYLNAFLDRIKPPSLEKLRRAKQDLLDIIFGFPDESQK